jgi:hypothetical protein
MLVLSVTGVELLLVPRPKFLVDNLSKWLRPLLEGLELHLDAAFWSPLQQVLSFSPVLLIHLLAGVKLLEGAEHN